LRLLRAALFVALCSFLAFGAEIRGTVTDDAGATQPEVTLSLRREEGKAERLMKTHTDGRYEFSDLSPGHYELRLSCKCFKTVKKRFFLEENSQATMDFKLDLAEQRCRGID
jgi:hypothetical protein